jgi:hypothetical protein
LNVMLTCAISNLGFHFTVLLILVCSMVTVSCPLCTYISLLLYILEIAGPLKHLRLSVEYTGSEPYLDQNLEQNLIDKVPSVCNITFSDSKESYSEEHA